MKFIEDYAGDALELGIGEQTSCEHAFGEESQASARTRDLFEPYLIADGFADGLTARGGDETSGQSCGEAAGLEDEYVTFEEIEEGGWDTGGLAGAGGRFEYEAVGGAKMVANLGQEWIDGERGSDAFSLTRRLVESSVCAESSVCVAI